MRSRGRSLVPLSVVAPGFFGGGGGGVGGVRVLGEVRSSGVLDLRGVDHVLAVVRELDVRRGAGPLAVAGGVVRGGSVVRGRGGRGVVGGGQGVRAVGRVLQGGEVGGLQVGNLRGVDHATVVGQGSGAVFVETWNGELVRMLEP